MKKVRTVQIKRDTALPCHEHVKQEKCFTETQQHSSLLSETDLQEINVLHSNGKPFAERNSRSVSKVNNFIIFPPFPHKFLKLSPEDFILPDDFIESHKLEASSQELVVCSPVQDLKIPTDKHSINNSDLADTVPLNCLSSSPLKMSPEKKDQTLLEARAVSPILLHKPTMGRCHLYSRRMKCFNSSVRSKRSLPKQIPLVLDDIMTKINENLPELTQIDDVAWRKKSDNSVLTVNKIDDLFQADRISQMSKFESNILQTSNGEIIAAFCESEIVTVVQKLLVTFLCVNEKPNYAKCGKVARNEIPSSINQIFTFSSSMSSVCACIEIVLAKHFSGEQWQLMTLVYTFNQLTGICSAPIISLLKLPQYVSSIKACPVQQFAFVMCWPKENNTSTQVMKYTLDEKYQSILNSSELRAVRECVNSLHSLKGCQQVVLGEITSAIRIWDLNSGNILKTVDYGGLTWNSYLWCNEDRGFLFSAVAIENSIHVIATNLTTGKFKVLRQYAVPESFSCRSSGLHVEHNLVMATFPEGFVTWDLSSSNVALKAFTDFQLFLSKENMVCITPCKHKSDIVLKVLDVAKIQ